MDELGEERKSELRKKQTEIIRILDAVSKLKLSEEWQTLNELVFSKSLASVERQMLNEARNQIVETSNIYKLQGEWSWAKQYGDLNVFASALKKQLEDIKNLLK